jgi:hypothetical protein
MIDLDEIRHTLGQVDSDLRKEDFQGTDPYDALNSQFISSLNSKLVKLAFTQFLVYSPINLRTPLKIGKGRNPKSLALILSAYSLMKKNDLLTQENFDLAYKNLFEHIKGTIVDGYSGPCWGFNFDWQDLSRFAPKRTPTVVVTSFVANSLLDLYDITKQKELLDLAENSCKFITNDLHIEENENGICFSYTPIDQNMVHNANLLGAQLLARVSRYRTSEKYHSMAKRALEFSLSYQEKDGSWAYSMTRDGKKRMQIDFHQGFVLDSILAIVSDLDLNVEDCRGNMENGLSYYWDRQFNGNGQSKWRVPRSWPVDIHNQAQGTITFSKYGRFFNNTEYLDRAERIAGWTLSEMHDGDGHFYYHKWPMLTNKISYLRWSQAWMFRALATLYDSVNRTNGSTAVSNSGP